MTTYVNGLIGNQNTYSNTGPLQYSFDLSKIEKVMLIPKGRKFTQTEVKTMYTVLSGSSAIGSVSYATPELRGYPIGDFIGCENKSTESTINTTGYGQPTFAKEGVFMWEFEFKKGGLTYHNMLKSFQDCQENFDMLIFDYEKNTIVGTTPAQNAVASGGQYVLQGISLSMVILPLPKINTGSNTTQHYIQFSLADATEITKRLAVVELPKNQPLRAINGLRNLEYVEHTCIAASGTILKTRAVVDGGAYDVYDLYGTAIAALSANFSATVDTSSSITATTVAVALEAATKTIKFTFTFTGGSVAAGDAITITPPSISQMAATIPGFASQPFTVLVA